MTKLEEIGRELEEHVKRNGFSSYEDAVRVIVRAMREPSEEMKFGQPFIWPEKAREIWIAMIDAILSEAGER